MRFPRMERLAPRARFVHPDRPAVELPLHRGAL